MGYKDGMLAVTAAGGQTITADADSTYYLDFEVTNPEIFNGRPVAYIITVVDKTTAGTSVQFKACQKASEPTEDDADIADWLFLAAELTEGKEIVLPLPSGKTWLRYHRLYVEIAAGTERYTFAAYLGPDPRC